MKTTTYDFTGLETDYSNATQTLLKRYSLRDFPALFWIMRIVCAEPLI